MVRWQHFGLTSYPKNADTLVAAAYPNDPYDQVAEAFGIELPPEPTKSELPFVDQRRFTPDSPVPYLNQFKIRT